MTGGTRSWPTEWLKAITQPAAASQAAEGADLEPPPPSGQEVLREPAALGAWEE